MALIYLVEDDLNIREIESIALKNNNYTVAAFDCAQSFFQQMEEILPDLVILDIMLPDQDGYEIIRLSELDHNELPRKFTTLDLAPLAEECCRNLSVSARNRNLSLTCKGYSAVLSGDRDLLKELIENLIQNAIQYNRESGSILVRTGQKDDHPFLSVQDTGIGIPKNQQERIFERFYRIDKSRSRETGGTGLGLAIVKHIAEIHDADITVDSEPGKGTCITVSF